MSRRRWSSFVAVLIVLGVVGGAVGWWLRAPKYDLAIHPRVPDVYRAWPLTNFWVWTAQMPQLSADEKVALCVNMRSMARPGENRSSGLRSSSTSGPIKAAEAEATTSSGSFTNAPDAMSGSGPLTVSVQLIDPSVLAPSPSATRPAVDNRLLATISRGGVAVHLTGVDRLPLQGRIAGWESRSDRNWDGNALLLMRFWTEDDEYERQFEVMLVRWKDAIYKNVP